MLATCGVAVLAICVLAQTYMPANGYKISAASYSRASSGSAAFCIIKPAIGGIIKDRTVPANGYKISAASYSNNGSVIIKSTQGTVLVMTESTPISRIKRNLNDEYSTNLDCVIILGDDTSATAYAPQVASTLLESNLIFNLSEKNNATRK